MQLTKHTDYALRVLMYVARKRARCTVADIAAGYQIPRSHVMKLVHQLAGLGYLETVRGKGGGVTLARRPGEINVGRVVRETEETLDVLDCLSEGYAGGCGIAPSCTLKSALRGAQQAFYRELDRYTLADIVPGERRATIAWHARRPAAATR
ncbi:MAG TPA: Rrf2 family transcriptional regulator [Burkholderiales bacterium]|nr:Rrf2 family transcriptional regulator [Burkholderiales bacterium]